MNSDPNHPVLSALSRVEQSNRIHFWGTETTLKEIEIPRLQLHFTVVKTANTVRAYSTEVSGYFLATHQTVRELAGFDHYLVLENNAGLKQVIIPNESLYVKRGALSTQVILKHEMTPEHPIPPYFRYDVNKQGQLTSTVPEDNLFIAYLFLLKKEYEMSAAYLKIFVTDSKRFSKLALDLFGRLQRSFNTNKDASPKACAVYLHALIAYYKNVFAYEDMESDEKTPGLSEGLEEIYKKYLIIAEHTTSLSLSVEEELFIIHYLKKDASILARQYVLEASIDSKHRPLALVHLKYKPSELPVQSLDSSIEIVIQLMQKGKQPFSAAEYNFLQPEKKFQESFYQFYEWAQSGTEDKRVFVKEALRLMKFDQSLDHHLRFFLLAVLENPHAFECATHFFGFDFSKVQATVFGVNYSPEQTQAIRSKELRRIIAKTILDQKNKEQSHVWQPTYYFANETVKPFQRKQKRPNHRIHNTVIPISPALTNRKALFEEFTTQGDMLSFSSAEIIKQKTRLAMMKAIELKSALMEEANILELVHKSSNTLNDKLEYGLEHLGTTKTYKTLFDLIPAFIQSSIHQYQQINPKLTEDDIKSLNQRIRHYFQATIRAQILDQALVLLEEIEAIQPVTIDHTKLQLALRKYNDLLHAQQHYDPEQNPEYLVFESLSGWLLRPKQIANLDRMMPQEDTIPNIILQMLMGEGKSKVLLPLLALKKANGDRLVIIVVPDALYETTVNHMYSRSYAVFMQKLHTLEVERNTEFTPEKLKSIFNLLEHTQLSQGYLIMTPKSLLCLRLKMREVLFAAGKKSKRSEQEIKSIEWAKKILGLIKTKGDAIIDEADTILNCRQEVNFTIGTLQAMKQTHQRLVSIVYRCILEIDPLRRSMMNSDNSYQPITETLYHQQLKPQLLEKTMTRLVEMSETEALGEFIQRLTPAQRAQLTSYLLDAATTETLDWIISLDTSTRDLLAILKEECNTFLPLTLSKSCDVHYGFSADPAKPLAVPYYGNNTPSLRSEFENHYEVLNYTIQTYVNKGIPVHLVERDIRHLQQQILKELQTNKGLMLDQTAGYKALMKTYGMVPTRVGIMQFGLKEFEQITTHLNQDLARRIDYIENVVLPELKIVPEKLNANHLDLVEIFSSCQGFTGTPWNYDSFHDSLVTIEEEETNQQTVDLLKRKCASPDHIRTLSDTHFPDVIDALLARSQYLRAIIDTGALFHGISNEAVASALLLSLSQQKSDIKGVIFMRGDEPFILELGAKGAIPLGKSTLKEHERFTYFDQPHTIGIDIKQAPFAIAIVTVGKDSMYKDVTQGAWRMREIAKNQDIHYVLLPETLQIMEQMNLPLKPVTFDSMLEFLTENEFMTKREHLITSFQQKIRHVVLNEIEQMILNDVLDRKKQEEFLIKAKGLFCAKVGDAPFQNFGLPKKEIAPEKAISEYIVYVEQEIETLLSTLDAPIKSALFTNISTKMQALKTSSRIALLPEKILPFIGGSNNLQQETMTEVKKETKQEVLRETHTETMCYRVGALPVRHWSWGNLVLLGRYRTPNKCRVIDDQFLRPMPIEGVMKEQEALVLPEAKSKAEYDDGDGFATQSEIKEITWELVLRKLMQNCFPPTGIGFYEGTTLNSMEQLVLQKVYNAQKHTDKFLDYTLDKEEEIIFEQLFTKVQEKNRSQLFFDLLWDRYDFKNKISTNPPILHAGDVFKVNPSLEHYQSLFNPKLLTTYNFTPLQNFNDCDEQLDEPYHAVKAEYFLVIKNPNQPDNYQLMFLTLSDVTYFSQYLATERTYSKEGFGPSVLAIYNLNLGVIQSGKHPISDEELNQSDSFQSLLVQAKFLAGTLYYSKQEQLHLSKWLSSFPINDVETFFKSYILKYAPEKSRLYPESSIKHLFDQLRKDGLEIEKPTSPEPRSPFSP